MYVSAISSRFSRGMSTPEIRATWLTLPLLVPRVRADDEDPAVPADHLALLADRFHAGTNFHGCLTLVPRLTGVGPVGWSRCRLLVAVGDPPTVQVVGRDLHLDPVTWEDADPVHPHLARAVREHLVPVL